MGKLAGKIALVTGASKGIGRGIALAFAREGADLLLSARGEESLASTAKEVAALGVRVEVQAGDVGSEEDVNAMFAHWQQSFDRLDLLVDRREHLGLRRDREDRVRLGGAVVLTLALGLTIGGVATLLAQGGEAHFPMGALIHAGREPLASPVRRLVRPVRRVWVSSPLPSQELRKEREREVRYAEVFPS